MPCKAEKLRKDDRENSMSTSRVEPCAEAQLEETSCTKDKKSTASDAHKIDAYESQRCCINESGKQRHEKYFAVRGHNSMSLYNLVHLPIPLPKAMNIPGAKAAVDKEWATLVNLPAWQESRGGARKGNTVHLPFSCGLVSSQTFRIGQEIPEV